MNRRWLARALTALAVPALLVPTLSSPATAAAEPPAVPTLDAVAQIYPHVADGQVVIERERRIRMPSRSCHEGKVVRGAVGQAAFYAPDDQTVADLAYTGAEPAITVTAESFPSPRTATRYLRAIATESADCDDPDAEEDPTRITKIRFRLGTERWGARVVMGTGKHRLIINGLFVRTGRRVVSVTSMSMTGGRAPSIAKSVELARLAVRTAR